MLNVNWFYWFSRLLLKIDSWNFQWIFIPMQYAHLVFGLFCLSVCLYALSTFCFNNWTSILCLTLSVCPFHSFFFVFYYSWMLSSMFWLNTLLVCSYQFGLSASLSSVCVCACVWLCVCLIWRDQLISIYNITHNHQGYRNQ